MSDKSYNLTAQSVVFSAKYHFIAAAMVFCISTASALPVTNIANLSEITISEGEQVDYSAITGSITVDGEEAAVTPNLPDTSILSNGRHKLVYSAITFSGKTANKETWLNVGSSAPQQNTPSISGVSNHSFVLGRIYDLMLHVEARSYTNEPLVCTQSIQFPEHLAVGSHTAYFTTIDSDGNSAVTNATLTVIPIDNKFRRAEWALLGNALYDKYFEPSRLATYLGTKGTTMKSFSYAPALNAIVADIAFRNVEFDMLSFDAVPMKIEPLTARMLLLLRELHHHRSLWIDQEFIIFEVELRGKQSGSSNSKERGIYSAYIPVDIFKLDNFDQYVLNSLKKLSQMPTSLKSRTDGKGKISHKLYESATGIKILFMEDLIEGFASDYNTRWKNGQVTLEENFDYDMLVDEYNAQVDRFNNLEFGRFTNPSLPFIKQQHQNL